MGSEMRTGCEKCGSKLEPHDPAYVCTFECTFCPDCTGKMESICPNCGGELVRRPRAGRVRSER
ncbi:MAG: DUF1272 domain-containing protein [Chthoniobacterales bacterium]